MNCTQNTWKHTRGDSISITGVVLADNIPMNIAGVSIVLTVRTNTDKTGTPLLQVNATIDDVMAGEYSINILDTSAVDVGSYYYDIQMTDSLGSITTLETGIFNVSFDVT